MRILKKVLRKLYHFIAFLSLFLFFVLPVKAETISNMTFSTFRTIVSSYGIVSNNVVYDTSSAVPVNMGISTNGFAFEWITNYTNKCSGQTIISGQLAIPNSNLNYDWYLDNITDIYYSPNISGVLSTSCTHSVNPSNMIISFSCSTLQPNNNFIIGGHLKYRPGANFNTYFRIYRTFNITCDNSASAIIDNNNTNTDRIINNNNQQEQQTREKIQENTDAINGIDDTLNDSSIDSPDNSINSLKNQLPTNSVISDLLLLPVTLLQSIVNSIGGTCSNFNLGSLYGTNLSMPCIDIPSYVGSTIWTFIDLVFSGMFILSIRKKFIQIWENITNLKGGSNEVD